MTTFSRNSIAVAFALTSLSVACTRDESSTDSRESSGGTLVITASGDPETLLPPLASTVSSKLISDMVYDRLAMVGDSMNVREVILQQSVDHFDHSRAAGTRGHDVHSLFDRV